MKGKQVNKHVKQRPKNHENIEKESKQNYTCESRSKKWIKKKLGFLGWFMHMHEQPCVHLIKPASIGKIIRM